MKTWKQGIISVLALFALAFSACDNGGGEEGTGGETTITPPQTVQTPDAYPSEGTVASGTSVSLSTLTSWATIYYTTDGSEPTVNDAISDYAIVITRDTTIKAIAVKEGMIDSDIFTATYTIDRTPLDAPSNFTVEYNTPISGASIFLYWEYNTPNIIGFRIYERTDLSDEFTLLLDITDKYKTGYSFGGKINTTYYIKIEAYNYYTTSESAQTSVFIEYKPLQPTTASIGVRNRSADTRDTTFILFAIRGELISDTASNVVIKTTVNNYFSTSITIPVNESIEVYVKDYKGDYYSAGYFNLSPGDHRSFEIWRRDSYPFNVYFQ